MTRDWSSLALALLVGPRTRTQAWAAVALPLALAVVSFVGYATDLFVVASGCLVVFPETVGVLGAIAAFVLGYHVRGFLVAALALLGGALGYRLASLSTGYAGWTLTERVRDLLRLDAIGFYGVLAVGIAFWPFVLGLAVGEGVRFVRENETPSLAR